MFVAYRCRYIRHVAEISGAPPIRDAATLVAVRDRDALEVLMVRRSRLSAFMPSAWVFPGGAVEDEDRYAALGDVDLAHRLAALRETREEAGVEAPADLAPHLVPLARWITPEGAPRRFDARFYITDAVSDEPVADALEVEEAAWVTPHRALGLAEDGAWVLTPPTRAQLAWLQDRTTAAEAMAAARFVDVRVIAPRVTTGSDGRRVIVMPGDPGYAEA